MRHNAWQKGGERGDIYLIPVRLSGLIPGTCFDKSGSATMFQRDYISRVIEEMANVTARILGFRLEGRLKPALELVDDYYKTYIRFDKALLPGLSAETLHLQYKMDLREIDSLSNLLDEEGALLMLQEKREEAKAKWEKALKLLDYVHQNDKITFSAERLNRMSLLKHKINNPS
jgi:hypothetical protein